MTNKYAERLRELGIELPQPATPLANYVPYVKSDDTIYISGQLPMVGGKPQFIGRVGEDLSIEDGRDAARACAMNIIAQLRDALGGNLDRMKHCVKLGGFVACAPGFTEHPAVINGASDLMVEVFGDAGRHSRFAVGVQNLPFGVGVEIDAVFTRL